MFTIIVGGLGFGFAILAVVLVIVSVIKGKHALSGQVVPLQQIDEIFNPGQQNMIEIVEEKRSHKMNPEIINCKRQPNNKSDTSNSANGLTKHSVLPEQFISKAQWAVRGEPLFPTQDEETISKIPWRSPVETVNGR